MAGYDNNKLGELRPNQIITTFGPGAIVDAVKDSVTVLDINYWKEKGKKIIDGRLASYLGVDCFYMPRTSYSGDVPVISFPMAALHAKVISVDEQQTLITSANLSYHGQEGNIELGTLVDSKKIARQVDDVFTHLIFNKIVQEI